MIEVILQSELAKEDNTYILTLRTEEGKELFERKCAEMGLKCKVVVKPSPKHFASNQDKLANAISKSEILPKFIKGLGLELE